MEGGEKDIDGLEPYDLSDDDEDLAPVQKPRYLRRIIECTHWRRQVAGWKFIMEVHHDWGLNTVSGVGVAVLRARDEDEAYDRHASALKEVEGLVRSRPADLPDLSCALARDLLSLENRFNMDVSAFFIHLPKLTERKRQDL